MKNIKEKENLIKMSLALGVEPDPKLVAEVAEYKEMMKGVKSVGEEFSALLSELGKLKTESNKPKKEVKVPTPPTVEEVLQLFTEEETKSIPQSEIPLPPTLEELMEEIGIDEEQKVEIEAKADSLIELAAEHIKKEAQFEERSLLAEQEVPLTQTISDLKNKIKYLEQWVSRIAATGPGSGEVNLLKLDDVDTRQLANNRYLRYNAANSKIEFASVSGGSGGAVDSVNGEVGDVVLTTANINEDGNLYFTNARAISAFTAGQNLSINANGLITATVTGGGGSVDLGNVSSNIVPTADSVYDLGSPSNRWKTLYLANNTIDLGGSLISSDGTGQISISGTGAVLPSGSRIDVGTVQQKIALVGDTGVVINVVPFYTRSRGLNTIAANFEFGYNPDDYTFTSFTLSNGTSLQRAGSAQFYF